jgi:transcriptional antiterminator NusG
VDPVRSVKPEDIDPAEVQRILRNLEAAKNSPRVDWQVGDELQVIEGPFNDFKGQVEKVRPDRDTLRARLDVFGRDTPVELCFDQVKKLG